MTMFEIYDYLKPPIELIDHLERYESKAQLPAPILDYLNKWRTIRSDQPFVLDGLIVEAITIEKVIA